MANFFYKQEDSIDLIHLEGELDEETLLSLKQTITQLRQQGSRCILLVGKNLTAVKVRDLSVLNASIRVFRQMGGKIAIAEFGKAEQRLLENNLFYRHLNVFQTENEARNFLKP